MKRIIAVLIGSMLLAGTADVADAQGRAQRKARKHYKAAQALEEVKNYEGAAQQYLRAYQYFPNPEFFFNAGRAYQLNGDVENALKYYNKYISDEPDGRAVDRARQAIATLEAELAAKKGLPDIPLVSPLPQRLPEPPSPPPAPPQSASNHVTGTGVGADVLDSSSRPSSLPSKKLKIAGLGAAGAGLVAAGAGVFFGLRAQSLGDDISSATRWTEEDLDKFSQGESAETMSIVFSSIGAVGVVSGVVLYVLGSRGGTARSEQEGVSWTPVLVPTQNGPAAGVRGHW